MNRTRWVVVVGSVGIVLAIGAAVPEVAQHLRYFRACRGGRSGAGDAGYATHGASAVDWAGRRGMTRFWLQVDQSEELRHSQPAR